MSAGESRTRPDVEHDFEAWAAVSARLLKRSADERAAVLTDLALASVWAGADAHWRRCIADDVAADRDERPARYSAVCAEEMLRRRREAGEPPPGQASNRRAAAADFRHAAMYGASERDGPLAPPRRPSDERGSFVDDLAPPGHTPLPPMPNQERTAGSDLATARHDALLAAQAVSWPVERYARYRAELEAFPDKTDLVCANYGLAPAVARAFVADAWVRRLDADPALRERFERLVRESIGQLRATSE